MTPTDDRSADTRFIKRVEVLLSSLTAVVSARVVLDEQEGPQIHVIATEEMPVSEVSRAVMSALTWGLGLDVPSNHVTVVQSRLSREELQALLETPDEPPAPLMPAPPSPDPTSSVTTYGLEELQAILVAEPPVELPAPVAPLVPPSDPPDLTESVPPQGLLEFGLRGADDGTMGGSELDHERLELQDLQLHKNPKGGFDILVRLADNTRSLGAQREATGSEVDSLEVPADAALSVVQEFLRTGRGDRLDVGLRFLAARRVREPEHDVVVVLVEAEVRGRRIPLTGAASALDGVERASVLATLQATNAFVAGNLMVDSGNGNGNGATPQ